VKSLVYLSFSIFHGEGRSGEGGKKEGIPFLSLLSMAMVGGGWRGVAVSLLPPYIRIDLKKKRHPFISFFIGKNKEVTERNL